MKRDIYLVTLMIGVKDMLSSVVVGNIPPVGGDLREKEHFQVEFYELM